MKVQVSVTSEMSDLFLVGGKAEKQASQNREVGIYYPLAPSEAEIQYVIVGALRKMGIDARAEVTARDRKSRFDVVIFYKRQPIGIIEVKKKSRRVFESSQPQVARYTAYGIPVILACGIRNVLLGVRWGKNRHDEAKKNPRLNG